jgi:TetR/AcrR family transcriptional regulator, transcriptional repressor for nem operon
MGHSQAQKAETHRRVVRAAAGRLRARGLDGVKVAELMKAVGLTHGGFYNHFASREALAAEALVEAFAEDEARLTRLGRRAGKPPLEALFDAYLTESHRDMPAAGCATAALAGDVGRAGGRLKALLSWQIGRYRRRLMRLVGGEPERARRKAALAMSAMAGALILARAMDDPAQSAELLADVRDYLKQEL